MIHFFLTFSRDAAQSPFGQRLAEMGLEHRIMAGEVRHRFRSRLWMVFVGRPMTMWFAVRAAIQSLAIESPPPRVVVVWTHIEALIVALFRTLLHRRQTRIVLVGFIMTQRAGRLHNWLRSVYFGTVFRVVDMTIVHSSVEVGRYAALFPKARAQFVFIPWASHVDGLDSLLRAAAESGPEGSADVLCAGRSGRDYRTLFKALAGTEHRVTIVCDMAAALTGCEPAANIRVLDHCYGSDYLSQVARARCVAVPLAVDDISAGQMVLLQAMTLGKPIVMTRTATTTDYVTHGHDALLVPPGDAVALQQAVDRVLSDPTLAQHLGQNAKDTFIRQFTLPAFVTTLVGEIQSLEPVPD